MACRRDYLFACLSAVLSSGPNAASELSVHALRRGFADLDDGKLLGCETVAKAVKKVLDLSQDATMLDIESMKAFFLSAGLSVSESQRCAKLAVVNKIPSPKKLSLLLFRDGPSALGLFSLPEEDGVLVRHALEQIYPVLVPPVSNYRRLSTLRRASGVGLAITEEEAHHENLPMHAEEILSRLKEVADSMTLTQLCSTLRQLLSLPDASLSEIVKAACKALGVRATGTLKEDATLCFFSAMEPAGGWKAVSPAAPPSASASVAAAAAEPFRPQQYPPHQPVTVGLPMAAPVQSKSLAAMLLPSTTFSPSPPRDRAVSQPVSGSGSLGRSLLALHGDRDRDRDQGQVGFGAPPTPLFFRDASSDKGAPHHAGTPPVLPTTVLPTLSTGTGTGTGGSSLVDTRSERTRSGASTSGSGGSFSPADAHSSSSSPSLSSTPRPAPSPANEAVAAKEETPEPPKDEVKATKSKEDNKPKSAKGSKGAKETAAAEEKVVVAQAEKPSAEPKEKEKVQEGSGATALPRELVSEKLEGSDDAAPASEPAAPAPPALSNALGPPEPEPEAADPSPPMAHQASPLVRQHTKPHELLSFAAEEEPAPIVVSAPSPVSAPAPAPVPTAPLSPITFPESAPSTPLAMMSVALDDTMLRLSPGAGREEGLSKASAAAAAAAAASAAAAAAVAAEAVAASTPSPESAPAPASAPAFATEPAPIPSSSSEPKQKQPLQATSPVPVPVASAAAVESTPSNAAPSAATPLSALTKTPMAKPDLRPTRSRSPADPAVPAPAPAQAQAQAQAPTASSLNLDQLPVLLASFYRQHNPGREKDCAAILNAYRGRELELVRKLETQYRVPFLPLSGR